MNPLREKETTDVKIPKDQEAARTGKPDDVPDEVWDNIADAGKPGFVKLIDGFTGRGRKSMIWTHGPAQYKKDNPPR